MAGAAPQSFVRFSAMPVEWRFLYCAAAWHHAPRASEIAHLYGWRGIAYC